MTDLYAGSSRSFPGRARAARRRARPAPEALEGRVVMSTVTVTRAADDIDVGSLRYAIAQVDLGDFDTIDFAFTDPAVHTIAVASALPEITRTVNLNPGLRAVVLDGSAAGAGVSGLTLGIGSDGSTIQGMVVENFSDVGIKVRSKNNTVARNRLGTGESGSLARPNSYGMILEPTATGNAIGGFNDGNVISGNTHDGILIQGAGAATPGENTIVGNTIGLNEAGTAAVPNGYNGVFLSNTWGNTVGAAVAGGAGIGLRNVISGNIYSGINLQSSFSNVIIGNFVGTDSGGTSAVPNQSVGVSLTYDAIAPGSGSNRVGGAGAGEGNVIAGNKSDGVYMRGSATTGNLVQGNVIGLDRTGLARLGNGYDGIRMIQVGGNFVGTDASGVASPALRNVISGNAHDGVMIDGGDHNVVAGNYIGTDVSGRLSRGNAFSGVSLLQETATTGARFNRIGGTDPNARNVISGNWTEGVYIGGMTTLNNVVEGNYIGVDAAGDSPLGNAYSGVYVDRTSGNTIGYFVPGSGNVVSGNGNDGVTVVSSDTTQILGNLIGTDATGRVALGNGGIGVDVVKSSNVSVGGQTGGSGPAGGNVISGNKKAGVTLDGATTTSVSNNVIGSDPSGTLRLGNPVGVTLLNGSTDDVVGREFPNMILYNATAGVSVLDGGSVRDLILDNVLVNSGPGIDLGGDGVTPNHTGGPRVGPNFYQNTPVLTFSANGHLGITLHSDPLTTYRVDYFSSRPTPPSAGPQAERERGRVLMTTDAAGNAGPVVVTYQQEAGFTAFSATATGPSRSTSELSSGTPDPNPLKAVALAASFTAGASKTAALAATVDLDPGATPGRLVAAINWGDGSPATAAVLVPAGPGFVVTGTHTYAKPGAFTAVVFVVDTGLGVTALTVGAVSVAPAPITAAGRAFTFTGSSVQFSGVVATVIDAGPGLPLNAYVATIAWGDGTTTVGTLTGRGGSFSVQASRRFTRFAGTRTAIITVADAAGRRAVALDPYSFK